MTNMTTTERQRVYEQALADAVEIYLPFEDGYLSSLKQAAADHGIDYGDEMEKFVRWAEKKLSEND